MNKAQRLDQLKEAFSSLRQQGVLSITDIVLNQSSIDSEFLTSNPDATYNLQNSSHLYSAWLLDESLSKFSQEFANCQIKELNFAPNIKSEGDLKSVVKYIKNIIIQPLALNEFFKVDVTKVFVELVDPALVGDLKIS